MFKPFKIQIFHWKELQKQSKIKQNKKQQGGFLSMLLGTLGASLLGNILTGKRIVRVRYGNKKGKEMLWAGYGNKMDF